MANGKPVTTESAGALCVEVWFGAAVVVVVAIVVDDVVDVDVVELVGTVDATGGAE